MAYRYPKRRSFWLAVWYSSIEAVEDENPWALAFDETEDLCEKPYICVIGLCDQCCVLQYLCQ